MNSRTFPAILAGIFLMASVAGFLTMSGTWAHSEHVSFASGVYHAAGQVLRSLRGALAD
ncbi:MAG TPA: hypothetical protein PLO69_05075 [Gammaproteobacteria bacterium]|nr:hypothetical protein [Gammaproteobacteria bacterium]